MTVADKKRQRAYELDFLRGFALIMMIFMHSAWDIRYEYKVDTFGFLESDLFWGIIHPIFIVIFVGVSGVCCTFSKNNLFRGLKLLGVAAGLSLATWFITTYLNIYCLIIFNVLAMLAVSILLYTLIEFIERKTKADPRRVNALLGAAGSFFAALGSKLEWLDYSTDNLIFLPVGFKMTSMPYMVDYMPLLPWLGVFFIGCLVGRVCYSERKSLLPAKNKAAKVITAPVEFVGRHSLIIYLVHQPVVYGIMYVIFMLIRR